MTIMELPEDITTEILSRLPADSVLICKGVCRLWGAIINDPRFRDRWMHQFDAAAYDDNLVTIACVNNMEYRRGSQLQYGAYSDEMRCFDLRNTPAGHYPPCSLKGSYNWVVAGSCNGLICLASGGKRIGTGRHNEKGFNCQSHSMYVGNPMTREYVKLPRIKPKTKCRGNSIGFGYCPTTKEYKVIVMYDWHVEVYIVGSGGRWRTTRTSFLKSWSSQDCAKPGVCANGALYFHRYCGDDIVSFDLASDELRKFRSPQPIQRNPLLQELKLGVLGGSLFYFEWDEPPRRGIIDVCDVWVMDNEDSWTKKFSIENNRGKEETIVIYDDNNQEDIIGKLRRLVWRLHYMFCYVKSIVSVKDLGEKDVISM